MGKLLFSCLFAVTIIAANGQTKGTSMDTSTRSVSCKLTTPELQKRKATVIAELKSLVLSREELGNGYAYSFVGNDQNLDKINDFIKAERMCCDFFTFQVTIEENTVSLRITGPEGAKEFLKSEVDL